MIHKYKYDLINYIIVLIEFKVGNFLSFKDIQTLRMSPVIETDKPGTSYGKISDMMLIYGPNGSGKSNLVKAMAFSRDIVLYGVSDVSVASYKRGGGSSYFEYVLELDGRMYSYGFDLDIGARGELSLVDEWLYLLTPDNDTAIFEYEGCKTDSRLCRTHLSQSVSTNSECDRIVEWFRSSLFIETSRPFDVVRPVSSGFIQELGKGLRSTDTGITDAVELPFDKSEIPRNLIKRAIGSTMLNKPGDYLALVLGNAYKRYWMIHINIDSDHVMCCTEIRLKHESGHISTMEDESLGTLRIIQVLSLLSGMKKDGGVCRTAIIDEIECSMHTLVARELLKLFNELSVGQLICTTHKVDLLRASFIGKDNVSFIDWNQGEDGGASTKLYTLRSFEQDINDICGAYLDGRMSAIPLFPHEEE